MTPIKVKYNKGNQEGLFVEVRTKEGVRYVEVRVIEGTALQLKDIVSKKGVRVNNATLKVEEEEQLTSYVG